MHDDCLPLAFGRYIMQLVFSMLHLSNLYSKLHESLPKSDLSYQIDACALNAWWILGVRKIALHRMSFMRYVSNACGRVVDCMMVRTCAAYSFSERNTDKAHRSPMVVHTVPMLHLTSERVYIHHTYVQVRWYLESSIWACSFAEFKLWTRLHTLYLLSMVLW